MVLHWVCLHFLSLASHVVSLVLCLFHIACPLLPPRPDNEIKRKKHDEVMPVPVPDFSPCDFRLYERNNLILSIDFLLRKIGFSVWKLTTRYLPESVDFVDIQQ